MANDNRQFLKDMDAFIMKANRNMQKVKQLAIFELFSMITDQTPLWVKGSPKRGNTKYNWLISVGTMKPQVLKGRDVGGNKTKERAYAQLMKATGDEDVYIHNSVPWIFHLEYGLYPSPSKSGRTVGGFSTQAPSGIVRTQVMMWNQIVPEVVRKLPNK